MNKQKKELNMKIILWFIRVFIINEGRGKYGSYVYPIKKEVTNNLPDNMVARTICTFTGPKVQIRLKYVLDKGVLNHELAHCRQCGRLLILHPILYKLSKHYRLLSELQAYREQVKEYQYTKFNEFTWIIDRLVNEYNIKFNRTIIRELCVYTFADILSLNNDKKLHTKRD